jgi:hypothetical protein
MHKFNQEERQRFLRLLIHEVIYTGSGVRIKGAIPIHSEGPDTVAPEGDPAYRWRVSEAGGITTTAKSVQPISSARIVDTKLYRRGHNSVAEVSFQISQDLPQPPVPLHQRINARDLRQLVERNPAATLHELCEMVQKQRGIKMSTTSMCRLVKQHHIRRKSQVSSLALAA